LGSRPQNQHGEEQKAALQDEYAKFQKNKPTEYKCTK